MPRYLNPLQETPFSIKKANWELFSTSLNEQVQELELEVKLLVLKELVGENPSIEIGEEGPLATLKDLYRTRDKSLSILVDNLVIDLTSCIKIAAEKAIPKSKTCKFSKLWWNEELLKKRQKMAKLGRLQEEQPTRNSRLEAYKEAKNQYFRTIREAKTSCWNSFLEKAQGKEVFTALKYTKEKTLRTIPSLQYSKDRTTRLVESFEEQCKAFITTLFRKPPSTSSIEWKDYAIDSKWEWPELEKTEVKQAIFSFSKKKAPGPDKLSFEILQKAYPIIEDL